jgi:fibronectin type 3 domain-containing protein
MTAPSTNVTGPPTPAAVANPSAAAPPAASGTAAPSGAPVAPPVIAGPPAHYYTVRTYGPKGDKSELSNQAILVPRVAPAGPEAVTVTARGDGILVEWSGAPGLSGYNVYRRNAQEKAHGPAIHAAASGEKSYLDNGAAFGQSYIYNVTAVATREPLVESATASEREIHYVDRFPPPPPADLVVLPETGRIRLIWRVSEASDLAGYAVYRRHGVDGEWSRISADLIDKPEYTDTTAAPNQAFYYRVTAIDKAGNESAPSAEVRAAAAP